MRRPGRAFALASLLLAALAGCGSPAHEAPARFDPDTIPEAYRHSTAALAWPGAARAFQITPAGDLWNGAWRVRVTPAVAGAAADSPRAIAFEERWRPIAHWVRRSGPVRWRFEAVALPEAGAPGPRLAAGDAPAPRDSGLVVSLVVEALNLGEAPAEARLELALERGEAVPPFVAFDAPEQPRPWRWATARENAAAEGWSSVPAEGGSARVAWSLAPGDSARASFLLPVYPTAARTLAAWARTPHQRHAAAARGHWNTEVAAAASFELRDPELERALRAALVLLLTCRERRGDQWVPIAGPLHYRDVWLRDGARAVQALAFLGRVNEARGLARALAAYQWPEGGFFSQRGQLDGTGQALWAFEQALLRPDVDDSVGRFAAAAYRAFEWCEWQRELGRAAGFRFGEMLPYGDPRDNELVRAQLVGNDAWALAGYRAAARLLRAAGRPQAADSVESARERYLRDFRAALERSGHPDLPPSWQGAGRDWGNLVVTYPCAVLPAADPRCARAAARVWAAAGGTGLASYGRRDSLHSYLGADLGTWALLAGRPADWEAVLDSTLAWRSASGGAAEIFSRVTRDYGRNLPPHATAAAALVALARNALVFDDGDTLLLTLGGRRAWWDGARVARLPTRWGRIDLEFARRGNVAEWRWSAVPVWTALTLPPGTALAGAPEGGLVRLSERRVLAPPGTRTARVRLTGAGVP